MITGCPSRRSSCGRGARGRPSGCLRAAGPDGRPPSDPGDNPRCPWGNASGQTVAGRLLRAPGPTKDLRA
ncbi:hypothetical protein AMK32_24635 [Streptomyces sp. CB01883]|nr:hypothetical protein AMK32_24635 [Streptomyces sp. CB01883]